MQDDRAKLEARVSELEAENSGLRRQLHSFGEALMSAAAFGEHGPVEREQAVAIPVIELRIHGDRIGY